MNENECLHNASDFNYIIVRNCDHHSVQKPIEFQLKDDALGIIFSLKCLQSASRKNGVGENLFILRFAKDIVLFRESFNY